MPGLCTWGRAARLGMIPCSARSCAMPSLWPVYDGGWASIQRMPSAATSGGSQSEWSKSGSAARKPSDATGMSIRNVLTGIAVRSQQLGGRRGEPLERGLRHPVRHLAGIGVERGGRRDVHDRADAPLDHPGVDGLGRDDRRPQVHGEDQVEALHRQLEVAGKRDRRVVDEDVDRPELRRPSSRPSPRPRRRRRGSWAPRSPGRRRRRSGGRCRRSSPGWGVASRRWRGPRTRRAPPPRRARRRSRRRRRGSLR